MGNLCGGEKSGRTKKSEKKIGVNEEVLGHVPSLPTGCEECSVDHVYDGDTLTVVRHTGEKSRVRLLGVDAPELREREAYAQQSANYLKGLCPEKSKVWLSFERDKQSDKYDRLLAYVYIPNPANGAGYYCVNICLLQEGLAFFYSTKGEQLNLRLILLTAQRKAIEKSRNLWKTIDLDKKVCATRTGTTFHNFDCRHVQNTNLQTLSVAEAFVHGQVPCRTCHPV